jgi:hypothetical protein
MSGATLNVDAAFVASSGTPDTPTGTLMIFGTTLKDCLIWLDSIQIAPVIGTAYATTPGYHIVTATKDGFDKWEKSVYVSDGQTLNVDALFVATAVVTPETNNAAIVFGVSVFDATIYIDEVETQVTPGVVYDFSPGYHGLRILSPGKLEWIKNVYLTSGDTLTVAPVFEVDPAATAAAIVGTSAETKRVYLNSNPQGAKIMLDGGFTGQWTPAYLDLARGFYRLQFLKSGSPDGNSSVWVGDTVAFGATAEALAKVNGVDIS